MPGPTHDVSAEYARWAGGGQAAAFSPDSPYGGDHAAVRSGRIDRGRAELHQAVERQLAATGSDDYEAGLVHVLSQARSGVLTLSQEALEGTGITATRPGRNGLRHHPVSGEVVTLAAAPTGEPVGEPPVAQEHSERFHDTLAYCQAVRPGATAADRDRPIDTVIARTGPTANAQLSRWLSQGGGAVAFG